MMIHEAALSRMERGLAWLARGLVQLGLTCDSAVLDSDGPPSIPRDWTGMTHQNLRL